MCNNNFGGCSWILILLLILCCCGNGGLCGGNNNDCGCGNSCVLRRTFIETHSFD